MQYTALTLQVLAILYHQLTTNVDLYPLNNVRDTTPQERHKEAIVSGIPVALPLPFLIVAIALHSAPLAYVSAIIALFIFIGASLTWWPPYFFGKAVKWAAGASSDDWNTLYNRTYAKTIIIVPRYRNRPRPNLEHNILHATILASTISAFIYAGRI